MRTSYGATEQGANARTDDSAGDAILILLFTGLLGRGKGRDE
jgi:hypothetical protein